jgi:chromosome segregation ATPase
MIAAISGIVTGLGVGTLALIGQRGAARATREAARETAQATRDGVVFTSYDKLVDQLQEELAAARAERDRLSEELMAKERELSASYAELASERARLAELHVQIGELTAERDRCRRRITELEGTR